MKKLIAFDLDGTLAESKSALTDQMSILLGRLLEHFHVCVISGGKFEQFHRQLISNLRVSSSLLERLHLMPTCGTRYMVFDIAKESWRKVYAEDFADEEKTEIINVLNDSITKTGYLEKKLWGELIEDRGSQITLSALGQDAPVEAKELWDPDQKKKKAIRDHAATLLPNFEVRMGGTTSIDVTKLGIDKAYGMNKLIQILQISKEDILFFGDKLEEGGNDYPVKAMGIDSIETSNHVDTARSIEAILHII
jgi:phosphomannomutase